MAGQAYFQERQRFRQPWLWILLLCIGTGQIGLFAYGLYQQLYLQKPWGNNPLSDAGLVTIAIVIAAFFLAILLLFFLLELRVHVDADGVHVRFRPFFRKRIALESIVRCEARTYRPILEYGGWGIRWSLTGRGWAYNVSGDRGVQLELVDGKCILIGSQRPNDLADAISQAKSARTSRTH